MRILLGMLLAVTVLGADLEALMAIGNVHYQNERYEEAVESYTRILREGYESGALHYNLGSSYFKLDEVGLAILHYQKAKKLLPRDDEIQYNLTHARLFRQDRFDLPEPMSLVKAFLAVRGSLTKRELTSWVTVTWIMVVILFLLYRWFNRQDRGGAFLYALIGLSFIFLVLSGWLIDRSLSDEHRNIVVITESLEAHSAPLKSSDILFVIHEGTEGSIEQQTEDWYEIRLPDSKSGWVLQSAVGTY